MAKHLALKLIDNLGDRFPQPELITAFKIFDPNKVLINSIIRKEYGKGFISIL